APREARAESRDPSTHHHRAKSRIPLRSVVVTLFFTFLFTLLFTLLFTALFTFVREESREKQREEEREEQREQRREKNSVKNGVKNRVLRRSGQDVLIEHLHGEREATVKATVCNRREPGIREVCPQVLIGLFG